RRVIAVGAPGLGELRVPEVAVAVAHPDQAELEEVARDGRLRGVESQLGQPAPDQLLAPERLVPNELQERALALSLHRAAAADASSVSDSASPNAATNASTAAASTVSGGVARTTSGPASVA